MARPLTTGAFQRSIALVGLAITLSPDAGTNLLSDSEVRGLDAYFGS